MIRAALSSLRARLLFFLLLAIVPALGLTLSTGLEVRRRAITEAQENTLRLLRPIATDTETTVLTGARQLLSALAEEPSVWKLNPRECSAQFAVELKQHTRFKNLGAITRDGQVFCSALPLPRSINVANRGYFQRAVNTKTFATSGYELSVVDSRPAFILAYPVADAAGTIFAVVTASLDLNRLSRLVDTTSMPSGSLFVAADHHGVVLDRYPDAKQWVGRVMPEAQIAQKLLATRRDGAMETVGPDGVSRLYAFTALGSRLNDPDLILGVGFPSSIAFDIARMTARNLTALGFVAALAFVFAYFNANLLFLRPMIALVAAARRLGAGEVSARTGLAHTSGEVGQLAQAFDDMAGSLQARQGEIEQAADALQRYAHRLETLHQLDQAILRAQSVESVASLAIGRIARNVRTQRIDLVALDDKGTGVILATNPPDPSIWPVGTRFPWSAWGEAEGLLATLEDGKTFTLGIQAVTPHPLLHAVYQRLRMQTLYSVPLLVQGRLVGSLNLWTDASHELSVEDLAIAEEAANQIAVGLESARIRDALRQHAGELEKRLTDTENVLFVLAAAVEAKDPYTEGHLRRLEKYSTEICTAMGLSSQVTTAVRRAALLHDVGKIGIPEAIIQKPGPLTPEEYETVKEHTIIGERICRQLSDGADVGPIVRGHHERWDGAGYPDRLAAESIPLGARIVAVADAWDAMTTDRPYRKALPLEKAMQTLREGAGTQWDRRVIEAFASMHKPVAAPVRTGQA